MAMQPAPANAEDDRLLRLEVEAALRSLTLVEGCPVRNLRHALEELGGNSRFAANHSDAPPDLG